MIADWSTALTEGKTRGNVKGSKSPERPKSGPPAPTPKPSHCVPSHAIKCDWIEIYITDPKGQHNGCRIEHHDNTQFWQDANGNLVVYKGFLENTVTYHEYVKYVTRGARHWR